MRRWVRRCVILFLDLVLINLAVLGSFLLRFEHIPLHHWLIYSRAGALTTALRILVTYLFGLYHRAWQYASVEEVVGVTAAVTVGTLGNLLLLSLGFHYFPPRSVILLNWMLNMLFLGGTRLVWRVLHQRSRANGETEEKRVLLVGAGDGGVLVARELQNHYGKTVRIVGFIDDDPAKFGQQVLGHLVLGPKEALPALAVEHQVDEIIISMPSVAKTVLREIVSIAQQTGRAVKILPGVFDLIEGNVTIQGIRHVELEDLLGRDPVQTDLAGISSYIQGKVVLVSGAGGSIGSELCRQLLPFAPQKLLLFDNCENNIYDLEGDLGERSQVPLAFLVKDVRDRQAVQEIFRLYRPAVVFHAAAHKHVPLMELNPEEAIKNNVLGTYEMAWAAHQYGAGKFVLVSTDKAVNPTSIMGASKRIGEMIIQYLDTISSTNYVAVRFGNVLGSRGSVIPLFKKQILAGGPVTVTHEGMSRYFMTIPEAVQLIIQAGALAQGGEIFVLDMGEPVRIMDLATTLIRLSGYEPYRDIDIKITGMRPGEKLFEELLTTEEGVHATTHQRIFVAKPAELNRELIEATLAGFARLGSGGLPQNVGDTLRFIQSFLPRFKIDAHQRQILERQRAWGETAAAKEEGRA